MYKAECYGVRAGYLCPSGQGLRMYIIGVNIVVVFLGTGGLTESDEVVTPGLT